MSHGDNWIHSGKPRAPKYRGDKRKDTGCRKAAAVIVLVLVSIPVIGISTAIAVLFS